MEEGITRNGYFQLVNAPGGGFGVRFVPPEGDGEAVRIGELVDYLDRQGCMYDLGSLKQFQMARKDIVCLLERRDCPAVRESYELSVSDDNMTATVRFFPPSECGERMTFDEFLKDLHYKNISSGIQMGALQDHFQSDGIYCTDFIVAQGRPPRQGTDAHIEYYFDTDLNARPAMREDGSVDFFNLNVINHCHAGDVLARIIPEDEGDYGMDIYGQRIKPRTVQRAVLKYGNLVQISEDKMSITSKVDGHVTLVDDKVFVSDVYEVENVDLTTGNITFTGSVQVNGNVASNYMIKCDGNVIINGVVEAAHIIAGGNIIIAKGMNGMGKGTLQAGGNVVAKFIENAHVEAENGYVETESILHSEVSAGEEVTVEGKHGFITGGHIQAGKHVKVKTLGAEMGSPTVIEVGINPKLKDQYIHLQKDVQEIVKTIRNTQPIISNFAERRAKGVRFSEDQLKHVRDAAKLLEVKKVELEQKNAQLAETQKIYETQRKAVVEVTGVVYPGTTIVIGDVSMIVQSAYQYCRFERIQGEVKMAPL